MTAEDFCRQQVRMILLQLKHFSLIQELQYYCDEDKCQEQNQELFRVRALLGESMLQLQQSFKNQSEAQLEDDRSKMYSAGRTDSQSFDFISKQCRLHQCVDCHFCHKYLAKAEFWHIQDGTSNVIYIPEQSLSSGLSDFVSLLISLVPQVTRTSSDSSSVVVDEDNLEQVILWCKLASLEQPDLDLGACKKLQAVTNTDDYRKFNAKLENLDGVQSNEHLFKAVMYNFIFQTVVQYYSGWREVCRELNIILPQELYCNKQRQDDQQLTMLMKKVQSVIDSFQQNKESIKEHFNLQLSVKLNDDSIQSLACGDLAIESASKENQLPPDVVDIVNVPPNLLNSPVLKVGPLLLDHSPVHKLQSSPQIIAKDINNKRKSTVLNDHPQPYEQNAQGYSAVRLPPLPPKIPRPPESQKRAKLAWTEQEVACLEYGMKKYGNSWSYILNEYREHFHPHRTNVDLKDKARNEKNRRIRHGLDLGPFGP
ncbi:hypothetical protein MP228_012858 [Amoeboaphelidium protococcarum]|nr:hypothetical protein MP228_012858 [Amoeboaphelidium protococcarum]